MRPTNTKKNLFLYFVPIIFLLIYSCHTKEAVDILITNGTVYNGFETEPLETAIAIKEDKIIGIGPSDKFSATRVIDATGLVVAPGFIDMHVHLDPITKLPSCESHVRQGVTTSLGAPDGIGYWPFKSYLDSLESLTIGMNVAYLFGHNKIRRNVMGLENRKPTQKEMDEMKSQMARAMEEGAFGISTGLKYLPGTFSEVEEVIELSGVAAKYGGIYTSHLREEGLGLIEGVQEAIDISREADLTVVLTHHKVVGKPMWGKSKQTLSMVDSARNLGLDIRIDQYPYNASYTGISILIPSWARSGGQEMFLKRLEDPALRDSIKSGIIFNIKNDRGGNDLERVQFAKAKWNSELEGNTLKYWAELKGLKPTIENGAELVIQAQSNGGASCIFHAMSEDDVVNIMKHPHTMIASDGRLVAPGMGHPHPRWYGTFPRVLGHYVRERKVISLSEAINKMTSLPAEVLGLADRGKLELGYKADITIFNPKTVIDKSTFSDPHQYPEGIEYVIINGKIAVEKGEFKDARSGKVLRKKVNKRAAL
ncbi:MAG TPA: amidohydrolase family protein [Cyclobacteriaceae bacterium]